MAIDNPIDTTFDVRTDAGGRDPDSHSATLRRYHRQLWSKPLPGGALFDLDARLRHCSALGEFWLSSDTIAHTYSGWVRPARLVDVLARVDRHSGGHRGEEFAALQDASVDGRRVAGLRQADMGQRSTRRQSSPSRALDNGEQAFPPGLPTAVGRRASPLVKDQIPDGQGRLKSPSERLERQDLERADASTTR